MTHIFPLGVSEGLDLLFIFSYILFWRCLSHSLEVGSIVIFLVARPFIDNSVPTDRKL